jgi:hypothetical protein
MYFTKVSGLDEPEEVFLGGDNKVTSSIIVVASEEKKHFDCRRHNLRTAKADGWC